MKTTRFGTVPLSAAGVPLMVAALSLFLSLAEPHEAVAQGAAGSSTAGPPTATSPAAPQEKLKFRDIQQALSATNRLSGESGPQNVVWIGENRFSYYQTNPITGVREIRAFSAETLSEETLFDPSALTFPGTQRPFEFHSFDWSQDHRYLLFQTDFEPVWRYSGIADFWLYSLEEQTLRPVAERAFTAELSPDGTKLGFGREGELFLYDLESDRVRQLTFDAEPGLYNGRFGWVYEEEFGKVQAWEWSPDSRHIAFWQSDERHVKRFVSTNYEGQYPSYTDIPYPKTGSDNPYVRIGVIDLESGEKKWLDLETRDGYIPRIYWTSRPGILAVVHLNRRQDHLGLWLYDVERGTGRLIMEERAEEGWIDISDFFAGVDDLFHFPPGKEEFFWISDRDGWSHLYRYDYDGKLLNQVTGGEWEVIGVHAIDPDRETIWYESTEASPLERHLFSVSFDGSYKIRYSQEPGRHTFQVSPDGAWYLDHYSSTDTPPRMTLNSTKNGGEVVRVLVENDAIRHFTDLYAYSPAELFKVTTTDGRTLDGMLIKPVDFDPDSSYPVLLDVYGGPGSQGVFNQFETNGWRQYLAQLGYAVVNINNRGSGGYGRDFEKSVYGRLGWLEAEDFAETARYLARTLPWADSTRMAIRGHSYGGYMAALTPLLYPDEFRVSIATAPVTDWRLYDTIYTERYMGLLPENEENYTRSSVMTHAGNLKAKMLLAHSAMDENVHIQNTMQLVRAFTDAGLDVDLRIYPPGEHGVAYNASSFFLLYETYINYLNRFLQPVCGSD